MQYYIADLHFFHHNKMDMRKFEDAETMNEYMIEKWNQKVRNNDEVIILGDFSIEKANPTMEILKRLQGKKYLIRGNHDKFVDYKEFDTGLFEWIKPYWELYDNRRKVILCHYPIMCYNGQYHKDRNNNPKTYMLYGHVHNTHDEELVNDYQEIVRKKVLLRKTEEGIEEEKIPCQMINCFCMFSDYTPLTLDEWIIVDKKRRKDRVEDIDCLGIEWIVK